MDTKTTEIMTPDHKLWNALKIILNDSLLFYQNDRPLSKCLGNMENTRKILELWPGIDVEATIDLFFELGGYCGCEVLMNVKRNWNQKSYEGKNEK